MANVRSGLCAVWFGCAWATIGLAAGTSDQQASKEGLDFFEKKIRPILIHNCFECHSGDKAKAKGHLLLDSRDGWQKGGDSGAAVVPGHAENSLLMEAIRYEGLEMPPKGKLDDEVIEDFARWIEMGAPDPRFGKAAKPRGKIDLAEARKYWAFKPPKAPPQPTVNDSHWPMSNIDYLVRGKQEAEKLAPVADADKITLIRRVTFDLTGLPPTPAEIDAFVQDNSRGALATVVDRLLATPQFGERWARHWLDVVRYAESSGKERNLPFRYAWRYRDYVIRSFNADKPYDRFVVEQIAGDLLTARNAKEKEELTIATGFLALGPKGVAMQKPEQFTMDVIDDQIDVIGRGMLGMTIACARCHDHKFDPIPTTDYYALAGIFRSTETFAGVTPGKKSSLDARLISLAGNDRRGKATVTLPPEIQERQNEIARLDARVEALRKEVRQANRMENNPRAGKGKRRQMVRAQTPPINKEQGREKIKELVDRIDELEALPTPPGDFAMGVQESPTPTNCQVLVRGEITEKGPEVQRGVLTVLKTAQVARINPRRSGRLELAHWVADPHNPLTARVLVNRVWSHLFGQGIVDTVDNFGMLGNEPSNPELLDALAVDFVQQGWSLKKLIRSIVLSHVYQLSSAHQAENFAHDPGNRFSWRMERRRLDAEEIRDAMLMASGQLDLNAPHASPVLELANGPIRGPKDAQELRKPSNTRTIYLPIVRGNLPDTLQVFDGADPSLIVGKRDVTTVPTQALYLMNNPFVLKQAQEMAHRVLDAKENTPAARLDLAFRWALGRLPRDDERASALRFLNDYRKTVADSVRQGNPQLLAWTGLCQTLFESAEFRYVY